MPFFPIAYSTNALVRYPLETALTLVSQAGFSSVEILADSPHLFYQDVSRKDVDSILQLLRKTSLTLTNLNANTAHGFLVKKQLKKEPTFTSLPPQALESRLEHLQRTLEVAALLHCPYVTFSSGRAHRRFSQHAQRSRLCQSVEALLSHLERVEVSFPRPISPPPCGGEQRWGVSPPLSSLSFPPSSLSFPRRRESSSILEQSGFPAQRSPSPQPSPQEGEGGNRKPKTFGHIWGRIGKDKKTEPHFPHPRLLIEFEPGHLIGTADDLASLFRACSSPGNLGANLDLGHLVCTERIASGQKFYALLAHTWEKLQYKIWHIHVEDIRAYRHRHLIPGLGNIDFKTFFRFLRDIHYSGVLTLELYPYANQHPLDAGRRGKSYLEKVMAE